MSDHESRSASTPRTSDLEDVIAELKLKFEVGLERLGHFQVIQSPDDIPSNVKDRPLHPFNVSDSDWAIFYRHAFDSGGYAALEEATQERAKQHKDDKEISPRENYSVINEETAVDLMMILASMYPGFLKGLIDGDLFYQYAQDPELHKAFDQIHSLDKIPGNYIQAMVQVDSLFDIAASPSSQMTQAANRKDNPDKGKGLTLAQLHQVYECAKLYLPSDPNMDIQAVRDIDSVFQPPYNVSNYKQGRHRYVQQGTNENKFEKWLKVWKEVYIDRIEVMMQKDPNDPLLHEPMRVSFLEIGWGQDVKSRANSHDQHASSNLLYTFFQALVKHLFGDIAGHASFDVKRLATNFLNRGDSIDFAYLDARVADVALTMIALTEWFNGGLNLAPGGGAGVKKSSLAIRLEWITEQAKKTYSTEQSRFQRNILEDQDKIAALVELDKWTEQDISDGEKDCEDLQRECQEEWDALKVELAIFEDVNLAHITQQVVQAGQFDPFRRDHAGRRDQVVAAFGFDGSQEQGREKVKDDVGSVDEGDADENDDDEIKVEKDAEDEDDDEPGHDGRSVSDGEDDGRVRSAAEGLAGMTISGLAEDL